MESALIPDLQGLGLTDGEAKVYVALLRLGEGQVTALSRLAEVERTNCYHLLKTLGAKGLVSLVTKGSSRTYVPEAPSKLLSDARSRLQTVQRLVPSLTALRGESKTHAPKVRYYDDAASTRALLLRTGSSKTEILRYSNIERLSQKFADEVPLLGKRLAKRETRMRVISPNWSQAGRFLQDYFPLLYQPFVRLLYVNPREFSLENDVCIFDHRVTIISLDPREHLGIVIESKVYAETCRALFNLAWLGAASFDVR